MSKILNARNLALLLFSSHLGAFPIDGGICNDRNYQGDNDIPTDINLYSSAVQHIWTCEVTDLILNLTGNEHYEVDYRAAGLYVGKLAPRHARVAKRSSWKSCDYVKDSASFTRLGNRRVNPRVARTAPACGFGFPLLNELKDILDIMNSAKSLGAVLEEENLETRKARKIILTSSSFNLSQHARAWDYVLEVRNPTETTMQIRFDGPWNRFTDTITEAEIDPDSSVEFLLRIPESIAGNEPREYTAILDFSNELDDYGLLTIPLVAPADLGTQLRGDVDGDGGLSISDGIALNNYLFGNGRKPACEAVADFNEDGLTNISDPVALFSHLFQGVPAPRNRTVECSKNLEGIELFIEPIVTGHTGSLSRSADYGTPPSPTGSFEPKSAVFRPAPGIGVPPEPK